MGEETGMRFHGDQCQGDGKHRGDFCLYVADSLAHSPCWLVLWSCYLSLVFHLTHKRSNCPPCCRGSQSTSSTAITTPRPAIPTNRFFRSSYFSLPSLFQPAGRIVT